ncbi:MAG: hypothetical protein HC810_03155, partial [Acaryochloridaceae cyanobacterium RL_2_7]|nr:hypothetical protein [Acaryochloridaceae cyanobacterium RL_2_7]
MVADEPDGAPVNGEREASATLDIEFASSQTPLAFATLEKTHQTPIEVSSTPEGNDDIITYELSLTVESSAPGSSATFTTADLEGTSINLNGATETRILISDVIPEGTSLYAEVDGAGDVIDITSHISVPTLPAANW